MLDIKRKTHRKFRGVNRELSGTSSARRPLHFLHFKAPGDTASTQYAYTTSGCSSCGGVADKISSIILPEGDRIDYTYDDNGKLARIADSQGNSVNYAYDSEGNRLKEEIKDPQGALQKSLSFQYDALNRLTKAINPDSSYTQIGYDTLGNQTSMRDPLGNTTTYQYDALSRVISAIQPGSLTTGFGYDSSSNLTRVTDANSHATTYVYDDLGRVYQTVSPDTGTTTSTYDPAGNLTTKTDAGGVTITYSYDALNRLTKIDFPSDTDFTYADDSCVNGKGPSGTPFIFLHLKAHKRHRVHPVRLHHQRLQQLRRGGRQDQLHHPARRGPDRLHL